jgi:PPOX class probable F420-dependent enzyme
VPDRAATLSPQVAAFLAAHDQFATLATLDADGAPRQAVIWYAFEPGGVLRINSREGRRWPANLRRDPRCSLEIAARADPYRFVACGGRVIEVIDDQEVARGDIVAMARRHHPDDPDAGREFVAQQRVTFRIAILDVHDHLS